MGYRSEVAFCLKVKEPEKFIALARIEANDALKEMLDNMYYIDGVEGARYILFKHNYWKWYDDSELAFHKLLSLAENYDEEFACRYARFGENVDDVQEDAYGDDGWDLEYPYVVQTIEVGVRDEDLIKIIKEEENATS